MHGCVTGIPGDTEAEAANSALEEFILRWQIALGRKDWSVAEIFGNQRRTYCATPGCGGCDLEVHVLRMQDQRLTGTGPVAARVMLFDLVVDCPKATGEFYTEAQIRNLLDDCSLRWPTGIRDHALISAIYGSGARISEALALDVADLRPGRKVHIADGKGGKARTIDVTQSALDDLGRWLDVRDKFAAPGSPVFCTLQGKPMERRDADRMIKRRGAKSGLGQRAHCHGLRHSHAVALLRAGVPVTVIMRQLGHSSLAVTTAYLNHLCPDDLAEAVQGISFV